MSEEFSPERLGKMIPALDIDEDVEYVWYVGDPVPTVGLWKRTRGHEIPIYQNTRGQGIFNGVSVSDGDIPSKEPTAAFWDALAEFVADDDDTVPVAGCEWYEVEFINAVATLGAETDDGDIPVEVGQLFSIAQKRGGSDD